MIHIDTYCTFMIYLEPQLLTCSMQPAVFRSPQREVWGNGGSAGAEKPWSASQRSLTLNIFSQACFLALGKFIMIYQQFSRFSDVLSKFSLKFQTLSIAPKSGRLGWLVQDLEISMPRWEPHWLTRQFLSIPPCPKKTTLTLVRRCFFWMSMY